MGTTNFDRVAAVAGFVGGGFAAGLIPDADPEAITTDGAVSVATYFTGLTSGAEDPLAVTLAAGAVEGQRKRIELVTDGGEDAVLTCDALVGGDTITFDDAGDYAELVWTANGWRAIVLSGAALTTA